MASQVVPRADKTGIEKEPGLTEPNLGRSSSDSNAQAADPGQAPAPPPVSFVQFAAVSSVPLAGKPARATGKRRPEKHGDEDDPKLALLTDKDASATDAQNPTPPQQTEETGEKKAEPPADDDDDRGGVSPILIVGGVLGVGLIAAAVGAGGGGGGGGSDNDPPSAAADTASATEGGPVVTGSVATNDSDPDGDPLTFTL